MSTADDATKPVVITTEKVAATECPAGQTNCTPANK